VKGFFMNKKSEMVEEKEKEESLLKEKIFK
jgi:hypothetical protein